MKLLILLEPPRNLRVTSAASPNRANLIWEIVEDVRLYGAVRVECREQGSPDWLFCTEVPAGDNYVNGIECVDNESQLPFQSGHTYEFAIRSSGAIAPAGPNDSDQSNIATVTF